MGIDTSPAIEAVFTMCPSSSCLSMIGRNTRIAIDDAPEVDAEHPLPVGERSLPRGAAGRRDAGVVADDVHGTKGVAYADLHHGNAIETFSAVGYDYAVEKAGSTKGWTFTVYEEEWNYGFPQEMAHFIDCVQHDKPPLVTGQDGRAVLEVVFAAYASARSGRKVELPFKTAAEKPHDLWKPKPG